MNPSSSPLSPETVSGCLLAEGGASRKATTQLTSGMIGIATLLAFFVRIDRPNASADLIGVHPRDTSAGDGWSEDRTREKLTCDRIDERRGFRNRMRGNHVGHSSITCKPVRMLCGPARGVPKVILTARDGETTLEPLEDRRLPSTMWTVDSLYDSGTGSGLRGDLRYVITQADQTPGDNTINFSVTGTITLNSALPDLNNTKGLIDIDGPGANNLTISGNNGVRVFHIDSGVMAKLTGLMITGGLASDGNGGGVLNDGSLTVTTSTIWGNSASNSAWSGSSYGGGIYNTCVLTVINSTISNNTAATYSLVAPPAAGAGYGGGIYSIGTVDLI